jgi:hypothetical protein
MARTSTARTQKLKTKAKAPKVVRRRTMAARSVARNSTARTQKRKAKAKAPKVVRRRTMAARIDVPDTKQPAVDARPGDRMEKATVTELGRTDPPRDRARSNEHHPAGVMNPPSSAPTAERQSNSGNPQTPHQPSRAVQSYIQAMGTAMQALQLLLALPFLSFQIWQNAMLGVRRLEPK